MDEQKPPNKWVSKINMENTIDRLINILSDNKNIFNIDYKINYKFYGDIHSKHVIKIYL